MTHLNQSSTTHRQPLESPLGYLFPYLNNIDPSPLYLTKPTCPSETCLRKANFFVNTPWSER